MDQALFARFTKCAVEVLSVDAAKIVPEASFGDDLEADSLDLVELVMALEEEFGIEVPESDLEGIDTVGKAFGLVESSSSRWPRRLRHLRRAGPSPTTRRGSARSWAPASAASARSRNRSSSVWRRASGASRRSSCR